MQADCLSERRLTLHLFFQLFIISVGLLLSLILVYPRLISPFMEAPSFGHPLYALVLLPILVSFALFQIAYRNEKSRRFWLYLTLAQNLSALVIISLAVWYLLSPGAAPFEPLLLVATLNLVLHCPLPGEDKIPEEAEIAD